MKFINSNCEKTWCIQDMSKQRDTPLPVMDSGGPQIDYDAAIAGMSGTIVHNGNMIVTTSQGNTWDEDRGYTNNKMS